jgi:hypothetical protein
MARSRGSADDLPPGGQPNIPGMTRPAEERILDAARVVKKVRQEKKTWMDAWRIREESAVEELFEAIDAVGWKGGKLRDARISEKTVRKVTVAILAKKKKGRAPGDGAAGDKVA